jgi:hypothetical protein
LLWRTRMRKLIEKIWKDPVMSGVVASLITTSITAMGAYLLNIKGLKPLMSAYINLENLFLLLLVFFASLGLSPLITRVFQKEKSMSIAFDKLIEDLENKDIKTSQILTKAKVLAKQIKDEEFLQWINQEILGEFKSLSKKDFPIYRQLHGELIAHSQYAGWETVHFKSDDTRNTITYAPNPNSVGALEDLLKGEEKGGNLRFPIPPGNRKIIFDFLNDPSFSDVQLVLEYHHVHGIINAVRNYVRAWAIRMKDKF